MSTDTKIVLNKVRSDLTSREFISLLDDKQRSSLVPLISSSPPLSLRKTVYLSAGGKYSKYEDFLRIFAIKSGFVPIHPVATLGYFVSSYSHNNNKAEIIRDCFSLILAVDELWVFDEKLPSFEKKETKDKKYIGDFPEGVLAEIYFWLDNKHNSPLRFLTFKDAGIPKYHSESEWPLVKNGNKITEETDDSPRVFAIIDLGSSTVKLTVCSIDENKITEVLYKKAITVNLAENFFEENILQINAITRTIEAVLDLQKDALTYGVLDIKLIGTGVTRKAKNLKEFSELLKSKTKLNLDVLSGDKEAKLIYKAVQQSFSITVKNLIVVNAGGGSTEIVIGNNEKIIDLYSLPLGISDLNEKFTNNLPLKNGEFGKMKAYIEDILKENIKKKFEFNEITLVYTGGELDYMTITGFPLENNEGSLSHPKKIVIKKLSEHIQKMAMMTKEELHGFMPDNPRWMDGAMSSNAILETISEYFNINVIIPSNKNLNDGILLEMDK